MEIAMSRASFTALTAIGVDEAGAFCTEIGARCTSCLVEDRAAMHAAPGWLHGSHIGGNDILATHAAKMAVGT